MRSMSLPGVLKSSSEKVKLFRTLCTPFEREPTHACPERVSSSFPLLVKKLFVFLTEILMLWKPDVCSAHLRNQNGTAAVGDWCVKVLFLAEHIREWSVLWVQNGGYLHNPKSSEVKSKNSFKINKRGSHRLNLSLNMDKFLGPNNPLWAKEEIRRTL